jgi:hypothetical protein
MPWWGKALGWKLGRHIVGNAEKFLNCFPPSQLETDFDLLLQNTL